MGFIINNNLGHFQIFLMILLLIFLFTSLSYTSGKLIQPQHHDDDDAYSLQDLPLTNQDHHHHHQHQQFNFKNTKSYHDDRSLNNDDVVVLLSKNNSFDRKKSKKKKKKIKNNLESIRAPALFSTMLPKGFIPPSGSSACHNYETNSVSYCE